MKLKLLPRTIEMEKKHDDADGDPISRVHQAIMLRFAEDDVLFFQWDIHSLGNLCFFAAP